LVEKNEIPKPSFKMFVLNTLVLNTVVSGVFVSSYGPKFAQGVFVSGIVILSVSLFWHFLGEHVDWVRSSTWAGVLYYIILTCVVWLLSSNFPIPAIFYAGTTLLFSLAITFIVSAYIKFKVFAKSEYKRMELPILPEEIPEMKKEQTRKPPFEVF
jgi:hypothetical protein